MDNAILFFTVMFFTYFILSWIESKFKKRKLTSIQPAVPEVKQESSALIADPETLEIFMRTLINISNDTKKIAPESIQSDAILDETIQEVISEMRITTSVIQKTDDAEVALKKLGYKQTAIKKAIDAVIAAAGNKKLNTEDIVVEALAILSKS